jgi:hypothetical protein
MHQDDAGEGNTTDWRPILCEDARIFKLACENPAGTRSDSSKEWKARSAEGMWNTMRKIKYDEQKAHGNPKDGG